MEDSFKALTKAKRPKRKLNKSTKILDRLQQNRIHHLAYSRWSSPKSLQPITVRRHLYKENRQSTLIREQGELFFRPAFRHLLKRSIGEISERWGQLVDIHGKGKYTAGQEL